MGKVGQSRKGLLRSRVGLMVLVICICIAGCTAPKQITRPDSKELLETVAEGSHGDITVKAAVLDSEQADRLLNTNLARRGVIPVLFAMGNKAENKCTIRREHFTARVGNVRVEPTLPGRAAALLRNSSRSAGTALLGGAVLGILAAPSLDAAEQKEAAAVEAHREVMFSEANIPPGGMAAGYLLFESPTPIKDLGFLELELCVSGNKDESVTIRLPNPYARDANK